MMLGVHIPLEVVLGAIAVDMCRDGRRLVGIKNVKIGWDGGCFASSW